MRFPSPRAGSGYGKRALSAVPFHRLLLATLGGSFEGIGTDARRSTRPLGLQLSATQTLHLLENSRATQRNSLQIKGLEKHWKNNAELN